jgi:hypothetical protein
VDEDEGMSDEDGESGDNTGMKTKKKWKRGYEEYQEF